MTYDTTILHFTFSIIHSALLAGAAVSFAAYLAMRHAWRIARASDWLTHVPRPRLAAFRSEFRHGPTPSNSYRFAWSGALAWRRADAPVDAAIELFRDGSVSVETNGVAWRVVRSWEYGETNGIASRAEAEAAVAGDWQYVFAVDFPAAPPETVCLSVGGSRVAVSEACECCFVLDKGTRHGISLSFVPEGVTCSWGGAPEPLRSARSGLAVERMRAYGSSGEVDFDDPADDGEGSILWDHSLYIAPSDLYDPTYPIRLLAWMDTPPGEALTVTWRGGDGEIAATGDMLTLSATEGAAVGVRLDSPDGPQVELPYEWHGYSGDVDSMDIYVTNNDPSRAGESVTFLLEFNGLDGEYAVDASGLLEVVKFRVEAEANWPSNKVRHFFGPRETFNAILENGTKFPFKAPLTPGESVMSFDYNGSTCTFPIRVIPPSGETGYWRADDFECSSGTVVAGFFADVQVLPTFVSFKDLWIMEDVSPVSSRWGCFLDLLHYPHDQFAHTPARGALRTLKIGDKNMIDGYDHAQTKLGELPSSRNGGFTLNIPLKWGINGGPCIYDAGHVLQTTSVQTNGHVTISKFGITRGRNPNGIYESN